MSSSDESVRFVVEADDDEAAGRAAAEAFEAGACGLEERESARIGAVTLWIYASSGDAAALGRVMATVAGVRLAGGPERVAASDWSAAWRQGLEALVISHELVVRPSCVAASLGPGQA